MTVKVLGALELESLVDHATNEVVAMLTSIEVSPCPSDDPSWKGGHGASYHGSIGLAGKYIGSLYLATPKATAIKLRNGMLGEESDELDGVADAIGEIINMLAGSVQSSLSSSERLIELSIPDVLNSVDWPKHVGNEDIPFGIKRFQSAAGPIEIGLQLVPAKAR